MILASEARKLTESNEDYIEYFEEWKKETEKRIIKAAKQGLRKVVFNEHVLIINKEKGIKRFVDFEIEGKLYLEKLGYKIVPTGIIGGVMQLTEDIIW